MLSTVSGDIAPSEIRSGNGLLTTTSFRNSPGSGSYDTDATPGSSDTKSSGIPDSACTDFSGSAAFSLTAGVPGASHVEANWLAFCASASHGLLEVLNHALPAFPFALSADAPSVLLTTSGATASLGAGPDTNSSAPFCSAIAGSAAFGAAQESFAAGAAGILIGALYTGAGVLSGATAASSKSCAFSRVGVQFPRRLARAADFSVAPAGSSAKSSLPPSRLHAALSDSSSSSSASSSLSQSRSANSGLTGAT